MVAIRFEADSHGDQTAFGGLRQLTPTFGLNLLLSPDQMCKVVGIDFGETAIYAMHLSRGEIRILGSNILEDSLSVIFVVDGELALVDRSAEKLVRAGRGEAWTFSRSSSFEIAVLADAQLVAVTLPEQVLQEFGISKDYTLQALDVNSTLLSPVLGYLREVAVQDLEVPSVAAYFMEKLVHEMIGGIMLEGRGARFSATLQRGFFEQAMSYIAATAGDASLTPTSLAAELSLSLRQLQREFKRNNTSIAAAILQHRIDLAVRLLKDPKMDALPLEQIARHSGFRSIIQLRRVLRDARVGSPSEIRKRATKRSRQ